MVRFGVIGTNWITEQFIEALKEVEGSEVVAVYSRTKETAETFSTKFSIPDTYTELTEMATSANVDAVYIASPNAFHAEQAILCMNHGKHVLCEKPIASNAAETQAMIAAAKENKVLLVKMAKMALMVKRVNKVNKESKENKAFAVKMVKMARTVLMVYQV